MSRRYTVDFLLYLARLRPPRTTVTDPERALLRSLAGGQRSLVEVGVHEGATSVELCRAMHPEGVIHLVDPYLPGVRAERWLDLSFARYVAQRVTRPYRRQVRFVRAPSLDAAASLSLEAPADLVFIDADHSYRAVADDLLAWAPKLAPDGVIAFHDSRCCDARPDLGPGTGPVRLVAEIRQGRHGAWQVVGEADSVTALRQVVHESEVAVPEDRTL